MAPKKVGKTKTKKLQKRIIDSPSPSKTIKGKSKISDVDRRKLRRLKKDELHELATWAGVNDEKMKNKNDLSHLLARNPKIAAAIGATSTVVGGFGIVALIKHFRNKNQKTENMSQTSEQNSWDENFLPR